MTHASPVTITLTINDSEVFDTRRMRGSEKLSSLFEYRLRIVSTDTELALDTLVGQPARVTISGAQSQRELFGVIRSMTLVRTSARQSMYDAVFVPPMWSLTQRVDSRVFQNTLSPGTDAESVVATVLAEHGFSREMSQFAATSRRRDIIVQFEESDWSLINRLLEDEGIFYWFDHSNGACVMVMSDGTTSAPRQTFDALAYAEGADALVGGESVTSFGFTCRAKPKQVTTWNRTFENPQRLDRTVAGTDTTATPHVEVFDYQPTQNAEHQLQALQAQAATGAGRTSSMRMEAGRAFTLNGHPRATLDDDYLVTAVTLDARAGRKTRFRCNFSCIPSSVPFRPRQATARPRIYGPQAATVVSTGNEVETDALGRVLVHLHWDRNAAPDGPTVANGYNLWVHVAQMAAGSFGSLFIPRAGSSVLVEFIGGNPDQPVVTGRVYNETSPPPQVLPANAHKSTIASKIFGTDERSELTFDDSANNKELYLKAQRNLRIDVGMANDDSGGRQLEVNGTDHLHVTKLQTSLFDMNQDVRVTGKRRLVVGHSAFAPATTTHDVHIAGDESIAVDRGRSVSVGDSTSSPPDLHDFRVFGDQQITVSRDEVVTVGRSRTAIIGDGTGRAVPGTTASYADITGVNGDQIVTVNGDQTLDVSGHRSEAVDRNLTQTVYGGISISGANVAMESSAGSFGVCANGGELRLESYGHATKVGGNTLYLAAESNIEIRSATSITFVIGSMTNGSQWQRKITLNRTGIEVNNGTVHEKLEGAKVKINC